MYEKVGSPYVVAGPLSQPENIPDSDPHVHCLRVPLGMLWNQNGHPGGWMLWLLTNCIVWSPEPKDKSLTGYSPLHTLLLMSWSLGKTHLGDLIGTSPLPILMYLRLGFQVSNGS